LFYSNTILLVVTSIEIFNPKLEYTERCTIKSVFYQNGYQSWI